MMKVLPMREYVISHDAASEFTETERTILHHEETGRVFIAVVDDAESFGVAAAAKRLNLSHCIHNGKLFVDLEYFRAALPDRAGAIDQFYEKIKQFTNEPTQNDGAA